MQPLALPVLSAPLRVLIVEDAPSTVRFLRAVLGSLASIDIVGDASTGQAAVRSAFLLGPDVILLDLSLPDTDGADILPYILKFLPETKVIVLSNNANVAGPDLVARGAIGFINKGLTPDDLVDELSVVLGACLWPGPPSDGPAMATPPLPLRP
jgi:two-component system response regulator AlgR